MFFFIVLAPGLVVNSGFFFLLCKDPYKIACFINHQNTEAECIRSHALDMEAKKT